MDSRRRTALVLSLGGLALAGGLILGLRRPVPPPQFVKDQADALLARDADALWAMADPAEVKAMGWTRDRAKRYLERFVFPAFEGVTRVSKDEKPMARNGGDQGFCVVVLKTPEGHRFELETTADRDASGTHAWFQSLITDAWFLRYMKRLRVDFSMGVWTPAKLEGLQDDRAALEAMGLRGTYTGPDARTDYDRAFAETHGEHGYDPVKPWDRLQSEWLAARA